MTFMDQIRTAQAKWIADGFEAAGMQGLTDARSLLAQAITDQNETLIRIYSETCLLLLEAQRNQAAQWMALLSPDRER
ncbi:hypothetical protein HL653_19895 [Sphingomonas sp. AP4-R1]|uniref:hypothetical protein n=1 Tax=Sphingomonas sp. AP4-R1 TaxID=2735134 RepID=UPI0014935E81|nr:hypothetical protein [Sphingomonas sp. AP4-R1]QJU59714.1 hypothetical protein HL653_19895 [Sphingomonas sp. AP4-R1]